MSHRFTFSLVATGVVALSQGIGSTAHAGFLTEIGRYETGIFDDSAAEIPAFDPMTDRLFVVNATQGVDVLDLSNPASPSLLFQINAPGTNSVAVHNGILAVAVQDAVATDPGTVAFYSTNLSSGDSSLASALVGVLPDMVTFTPDGSKVLVANEGEASSDGTINPEGSISVIDLNIAAGPTLTPVVSTAGFSAFNGTITPGADPATNVRISPFADSVAADLEPEYITVSPDGATAYVSLQENNGLAVVDIASATVTGLIPLGVKDHSLPGNGLDARDNDGIAIIETQPVFGMYMPDGIDSFEVGGQTYIITANEGDGREDEDFLGFQDFDDLDQLNVDPNFNGFSALELDAFLDNDTGIGDLEISSINGDTDGDGDLDQLYSFGARSFSIFRPDGTLVFDSGDDFEQITSTTPGVVFNSTNDENDSLENRSDDAGPEPESVEVAEIDDRLFAFIGLERVGGIMTYDITDPENAFFVDYTNNRDFDPSLSELQIGDLGPEGILFIDAVDSPNGLPLLVVAHEVSGTTTIFVVPEPGTVGIATLSGLALLRRRRRAY